MMVSPVLGIVELGAVLPNTRERFEFLLECETNEIPRNRHDEPLFLGGATLRLEASGQSWPQRKLLRNQHEGDGRRGDTFLGVKSRPSHLFFIQSAVIRPSPIVASPYGLRTPPRFLTGPICTRVDRVQIL